MVTSVSEVRSFRVQGSKSFRRSEGDLEGFCGISELFLGLLKLWGISNCFLQFYGLSRGLSGSLGVAVVLGGFFIILGGLMMLEKKNQGVYEGVSGDFRDLCWFLETFPRKSGRLGAFRDISEASQKFSG